MADHLKEMGVRDFEITLIDPLGANTVEYGQRTLNWKGKIRYKLIVKTAERKIKAFYRQALAEKECFYGPFKGEFGHFLLHNLPFISHLHRQGVRVHYCGMELHKPFLVDESGKSLVASWVVLRDFFHEVKPMCNSTVPPADVQKVIDEFKASAIAAKKAFLDISDDDMYWFVFRNWQLEGRQFHYDLSKAYGTGKDNSCVIFPRQKGGAVTPNNGESWNYMDVARQLSPFFDKIYLVGHPSLSASVHDEKNIEVKISDNNADLIRYCSNASLIVTQHSGAVHMGGYTRTPVLIIFKGELPIKGLVDTIRFRKNLTDIPLNYAFNLDEIKNFAAAGKY